MPFTNEDVAGGRSRKLRSANTAIRDSSRYSTRLARRSWAARTIRYQRREEEVLQGGRDHPDKDPERRPGKQRNEDAFAKRAGHVGWCTPAGIDDAGDASDVGNAAGLAGVAGGPDVGEF